MISKMSPDEFREFMASQCKEIDTYKWGLGERLNHDPLQDRTLDDIGIEWITKYAAAHRESWEHEHTC